MLHLLTFTNRIMDKPKTTPALSNGQKWLVVLTIIFIIGVLAGNWILLYCSGNRGTFGDMFGFSSAVFTSLAFAGIIYAALLQRNEHRHQKDETERIRLESVEQDKVLKIQKFETTFFNMMQLQNEIVKIMRHNNKEGRLVFDEAHDDLFALLSKTNYEKTKGTSTEDSQYIATIPNKVHTACNILLNKYFEGYYNKYTSNFNHYFRNLYHIFKFIYFSELELPQKNFYASLCRAQLSQNELFVIAFNILVEGYGRPKFTYLVKEFSVLKNFEWASITPEIYREVISQELAKAAYPFDPAKLPRPKAANLNEHDQFN